MSVVLSLSAGVTVGGVRSGLIKCSKQREMAQTPLHCIRSRGTGTGTGTGSSLALGAPASFRNGVTAADSDHLTSHQEGGKYYFVVANAKFMLDEEEHFKELLCERLRNYVERNKKQDFWLVIEPKFLVKFPDITKCLRRPAVALVSTNGPCITFMKLRLDKVLSDSFEAESMEEALDSNPTSLEFEKPANWVAPYPKYEFGWWQPFLSGGSIEARV